MSDSPASPPGLFILGMHRSGTSCLAGMLECAGFNAGQVDEWNPDNQKGNREHLAVTPLNEAVLRVNGGAWDQPPERVDVDARQRRDMEQVIGDLEAQGRPWFIKDPRILLIPSPWLELRPGLRTIGIFRHPLAVAQSLARRDDLTLEDGVRLWCRYNTALLERLDNHACPLVLFTRDSAAFIPLVQAALDEQFGNEIAAGTVTPGAVGQFFDSNLVHHASAPARDLGPELGAAGIAPATIDAAMTIWQALLERQAPGRMTLDTEGDAGNVPDIDSQIDTGIEPTEDTATAPMTSMSPADLDLAIESSDDPTYLFRRRISELEEEADFGTLQAWLTDWFERRPDDPFLCWELARLEWTLGRHDAALARAQTTTELAPGWNVPLERMAEWAMEVGDWETAAGAFQRLRKSERALVKAPALTMQLYFDQGEGFNEAASIKVPLGRRTGRFETTLDAGGFGEGVLQLRLDPINQPAVVSGVFLRVENEAGETFELSPTGDNAAFHDGRAWHFDSDDPNLVYLNSALPRRPLKTLEIAFEIEHVGEDARLAGLQAMKALAEWREALQRAEARCADLEAKCRSMEADREALLADLRHLDDTLTTVRASVGARLGDRLARSVMAPATLGRGRTSLDDLAEQWRRLNERARGLQDASSD